MNRLSLLLIITLNFCCSQAVAAQQEIVDELRTILYVDNDIETSSCGDYNAVTRDCENGSFTAYTEISAAAREVEAGITVLIQPGVYSGGIVVTTSGRETAPIIFQSIDAGVIIEANREGRDAFFINQADYIVIDGLTIQNANRAALRVSLSDHVTIRNSTFTDNGSWGVFTDFSDYTIVENCEASGSQRQHGIYISNSSDYPVIRGNRIHHNSGAGLHMNGDASMGGDGIVSHGVIENNIFYENGNTGGSAINMDGVTDSIVRNNLIYDNHASGISLYQIDGASESHNNQVLNNTIIMANNARWALNIQNTQDNKLFNNIVLNNHRTRGSILVNAPISPGFESDYNLVMDRFASDGTGDLRLSLSDWQSLGFDSNSKIASPEEIFVNVDAGDFRLKAGSPAIDAGTPLDLITSDLDSTLRPSGSAFDIGAYEF